ncbi:hypothetical protein HDU79_003775 [Rhizoclosmatium sp. JEL0117]|nr:hypothetical protein HDU79_003775 [Rhizoclosmatium sp. JEL0117]
MSLNPEVAATKLNDGNGMTDFDFMNFLKGGQMPVYESATTLGVDFDALFESVAQPQLQLNSTDLVLDADLDALLFGSCDSTPSLPVGPSLNFSDYLKF